MLVEFVIFLKSAIQRFCLICSEQTSLYPNALLDTIILHSGWSNGGMNQEFLGYTLPQLQIYLFWYSGANLFIGIN